MDMKSRLLIQTQKGISECTDLPKHSSWPTNWNVLATGLSKMEERERNGEAGGCFAVWKLFLISFLFRNTPHSPESWPLFAIGFMIIRTSADEFALAATHTTDLA